MIRAIPQVLAQTNIHFVIVGSGNDLVKTKKLAQRLGVDQKISFLGWIDHNSDDLLRLYQAAKIFVIPSPHETQSIVVMEAMAAGLPVIGPDSGALPELIKTGQNGFLFQPGESQDLATKIIRVAENAKLQGTMARQSLELILNHQSQESISKIRKIHEKILVNRSKK